MEERKQKDSLKKKDCLSGYLTQVFHGHPGCGNVKVWGLAPFALYIFVVIFLIFQLWKTETISL